MSGSPIKVGTDGWRAISADEFTFGNVRACAQAAARYFHEATAASREIVVGYDTRFASEEFAVAVVEVLAANGVPVQLCDRAAPTPVIGFNIRRLNAGGGVVITSSHNPALYSGFKVRTEQASAAPPEVLSQIEALIPEALDGAVERMPLEEATAKGLVQKFDPRADYLRHLGQLVEIERLRQAGLRVVVDPMHGAGAGYLRELLSGGRTEVIEIRSERNPAFAGMHNPEPIARNLEGPSAAAGGFAFRGHLPERDGILSGLYILDLMARRGKSLPELLEEVFAKVGPHYYDRVDITMTPAERDRIAGLLTTLEPSTIDGLRV